MLDFFLIRDEEPSSYSFAQDEYAGGIRMLEFEQAQYTHIIENHLEFYKDFRWSSAQVKHKLQLVQATKSEQFAALQRILQRAVEMNCGVMAVAD
ncbi:hypothetical protein [Hymenobacter convexus]|uniref:hypothetical protein n=1 Tax=Hymenobacter sp. CA1UV-4 TaxID=3063782 RepID=UPI00271384D0|nr:hypothetical protein [Hymenobacter sp. CA1UV-4]MDO7852366.1 hypothetical protein [Hymenobacter sp. CA1UV-4]